MKGLQKIRAAANLVAFILLLGLFSGCGEPFALGAQEEALLIRTEYIGMTSCEARMEVTADYGMRVYEYTIDLSHRDGETALAVRFPENLAGICARIREGETALSYDDIYLETGPADETGLSPMDAIPAFLRAAREGLVVECGYEDLDEQKTVRVTYRNSESEAKPETEICIWYDRENHGFARAEWWLDGFCVIRCVFSEFQKT